MSRCVFAVLVAVVALCFAAIPLDDSVGDALLLDLDSSTSSLETIVSTAPEDVAFMEEAASTSSSDLSRILGVNGIISVGSALDKLSSYSRVQAKLALPEDFPDFRNNLVTSVEEVKSPRGSLAVRLNFFIGTLKLQHGFIMGNCMGSLVIPDRSSSDAPEFEVVGKWKVGTSVSAARFARMSNGALSVSANLTKLSIGDMASQVGVQFFPGALSSIASSSGLSRLTAANVHVSANYWVTSFLFRFEGSTALFPNAKFIAQVGGSSFYRTPFATVTLLINRLSLDTVLRKFVRLNLESVGIFGPADIQLTMSTSDVDLDANPHFRIPGTSEYEDEIKKGFFLAMYTKLKSNCGKFEFFCKFIRQKLFDPDFMLQIGFEGTDIDIFAGLGNMKLSHKVTLSKCGLHIVASVGEATFGVLAELDLEVGGGETLSFSGELDVSPSEISLEFSMDGMWKKPFGIPVFSMGNLVIGGGVTVAAGLPSVTLAGEIWIGRGCETSTSRCIKANAQGGFDPANPINNFFSARFSTLTLKRILDVFLPDRRFYLPPCLQDSGFTYGLNVSYSAKARHLIPSLPRVPAGVVLQGEINLLGLYRLNCNIVLNFAMFALKADVEMSPVNIGGVFLLQRSVYDRYRGPSCVIDVNPGKVFVDMSGYATISVLGVGVSASVRVDSRGYSSTFSAKLGIFRASIGLAASYGSIKTASLRMSATLTIADFRSIIQQVQYKISAFVKQGQRDLAVASHKMEVERQAMLAANRKLCSASKCKVVCDMSMELQEGLSANHTLTFEDGRKMTVYQMIQENLPEGMDPLEALALLQDGEGSIWGSIGNWFRNAGTTVANTAQNVVKYVGGVACRAGQTVLEPACVKGCEFLKTLANTAAESYRVAQAHLRVSHQALGALDTAARELSRQAAGSDFLILHSATVSASLALFKRTSASVLVRYTILGKYQAKYWNWNIMSFSDAVNVITEQVKHSIKTAFPSTEAATTALIQRMAVPGEIERVHAEFDLDEEQAAVGSAMVQEAIAAHRLEEELNAGHMFQDDQEEVEELDEESAAFL